MSNKLEALRSDPNEEVYADEDESSGVFGVFGLSTGFCYATYADMGNAESKADKINKERKP